ncbi:MAG: tetratricopeptide repeat protein [Planctomycetes bacterium]|nr:tetratricopeptide repeat protein [Planctomycetota bacterium]
MPKSLRSLSAEEQNHFCQLVREKVGIVIKNTQIPSITATLFSRMFNSQFTSPMAYFNYLRCTSEGRDDLEILVQEITINETSFFRNPAQFTLLKEMVFPQLLEGRSQSEPLSILCAGCSTGEEPYSIAIAARELLGLRAYERVEICAADIDRAVLNLAAEGRYRDRALRTTNVGVREQYFRQNKNGYQLDESIRSMVDFKKWNISSGTLPPTQSGKSWDIIFCRNVIIYFDNNTVKNVIQAFWEALTPQGFLFLGHSETLWNIHQGFELIQRGQGIVYRKNTIEAHELSGLKVLNFKSKIKPRPLRSGSFHKENSPVQDPLADSSHVDHAIAGPSRTDQSSHADHSSINSSRKDDPSLPDARRVEQLICEADTNYLQEQLDAALECLDLALTLEPEHLEARLFQGRILLESGELDQVREFIDTSWEKNALHAGFQELIAMWAELHGEEDRSLEAWRKVIYLDSNHAWAYYQLGKLLLSLENKQEAQKMFRTALRVLESRDPEESVTPHSRWSCGALMSAARKAGM